MPETASDTLSEGRKLAVIIVKKPASSPQRQLESILAFFFFSPGAFREE